VNVKNVGFAVLLLFVGGFLRQWIADYLATTLWEKACSFWVHTDQWTFELEKKKTNVNGIKWFKINPR